MNVWQRLRTRLGGKSQTEAESYSALKKTFTCQSDGLIYAGSMLKRAAHTFGDDKALIGDDVTLSFKQWFKRSVALSLYLKGKGIKKNDRVVIVTANSPEFYIVYFAIWQIGAIPVPLNTFLHKKELAYILNDTQAALIFASDQLKSKIDDACAEKDLYNPTVAPEIIVLQDVIDFSVPANITEQDLNAFTITTKKADELVLLLYTSGTTGAPKGVMLSSRNIMTNSMQCFARLLTTVSGRQSFFCVLPLFHVFAQNSCMWVPVMTGSSVIIVSVIDRKKILKGLQHKPTIFLGVPALYGFLCLMKYAPLDSVKIFISAADAMPDRIRSAFEIIYGRKICSGYGLTEAAPVISVHNLNDECATNVVGLPVQDLECEIRNEQGKPLPINHIGELWVRGGNVMMGYYNAPEATEKVIKNGWLHTGDLASFDEYGHLAIQGRSKDLIIHKGFNIYPQEIENVLLKHPSIFQAAVIGLKDEGSGQIPVAFVASKDGASDLKRILQEHCKLNLAPYKIPRRFYFREDLPMNAMGKIDKKLLRKELS